MPVPVTTCKIVNIDNQSGAVNYQSVIVACHLVTVEFCRRLGIALASNLSQHINETVVEANERVNCILRSFVSFVCLVHVRPTVEYNSVLWSPHMISEIDLIEKIQRRFVKRYRLLRNVSYQKRLVRLGLCTLELHRLHFHLIFCYKTVFRLEHVNDNGLSHSLL